MKKEIPDGIYHITLEHHPNQASGVFLATILDGEQAGKGFMRRILGVSEIDPLPRSFRKGPNEN